MKKGGGGGGQIDPLQKTTLKKSSLIRVNPITKSNLVTSLVLY